MPSPAHVKKSTMITNFLPPAKQGKPGLANAFPKRDVGTIFLPSKPLLCARSWKEKGEHNAFNALGQGMHKAMPSPAHAKKSTMITNFLPHAKLGKPGLAHAFPYQANFYF
jgi:hypothetical protein